MPLSTIPHPSPNHGARPEGAAISYIMLHDTGMQDPDSALKRLCDPNAKPTSVSCHYFIHRDGHIFQLVEDIRRAWHAGTGSPTIAGSGCWQGCYDLNSYSIGIEIDNAGYANGENAPLTPYPEVQIASVIDLCQHLQQKYAIPPKNVIGHADYAPARKQDPAEHFPWENLAAHGIGLWPTGWEAFLEAFSNINPASTETPANILSTQHALTKIGYGLDPESPSNHWTDAAKAVLTAFQRHYAPHNLSHPPTPETLAKIQCLAGML